MMKFQRIRYSKSTEGNVFLIGVGLLTVVSTASLLSSCCDECDRPVIVDTVVVVDNLPPTPPDGVYSVTGDGEVTLYWNTNREPDLAGYDIYWNNQATGYYRFLATVSKRQTSYRDTDVINGVTKYYAVLAFDTEGLESDLSYETVFDTPRPEGRNLVLYDYMGQNSDSSGYDFSSLSRTAQVWNDPTTDVYFGLPRTLSAAPGVDVQDVGYVTLVDVDWAPSSGWSPSKRVELIPGHSYVVKITDKQVPSQFNFAKIYVVKVSSQTVTLDWAYQIDPDNPELAPGGGAQQ